jgi:hypothetical protein
LKRGPRERTRADGRIDAALNAWLTWLIAFFAPPKIQQKRRIDVGTLYEAAISTMLPRAPGVYADPTFMAIAIMESSGWAWAASVNDLVLSLPKRQRTALLNDALGDDVRDLARYLGVSDSTASRVRADARANLHSGLSRIRHVLSGQMAARDERENIGLAQA